MKQESIHWATLILRSVPESPDDMPEGDLLVEVPVHLQARPADPDPGWGGPLPWSGYIKRSDLAGDWLPLEMEDGVGDVLIRASSPLVSRSEGFMWMLSTRWYSSMISRHYRVNSGAS